MVKDVVIVGACTAGTYFANLLAQRGLSVAVIDKESEENLCKRLDIFHFPAEGFAQYNVEESKQGDEEFVRTFDKSVTRSALDNYPKSAHTKVAVMHLPLFIKRLRKVAEQNGVEFLFNKAFEKVKYDEQNRIAGVITSDGDEISARLVVDASGIPSVVRRSLNNPYTETFEITPRDKFYVLLKYVQMKNPEDTAKLCTSWPFYKCWVAPQHSGNGSIIGCGANLSYDYARKCMAKFEQSIKLPEYTLQYEEMGCTPYCRPPYSFVADGFLAIGDAACLTHPMSGEGVVHAWKHCTPAADIVANAMQNGKYPTVDALWKINELYQRGEGCEFAATRALILGAVQMSKADNDYMFKHNVVFHSDDEPENKKVVSTLLKGVLTGNFSFRALKALIKSSGDSSKVTKLYKKYPSAPSGYAKWKKKADKLWKKIGTMADTVTDA